MIWLNSGRRDQAAEVPLRTGPLQHHRRDEAGRVRGRHADERRGVGAVVVTGPRAGGRDPLRGAGLARRRGSRRWRPCGAVPCSLTDGLEHVADLRRDDRA